MGNERETASTYTDDVFTSTRTSSSESFSDFLELRLLPRRNNHSSSILDQSSRHHLPETTTSTGDDCDLAFDAEEVLDCEIVHF